ncbi:sulfatase [Flammeovirga sp. EKP202]|uniref:sulfatase family protein n=1 Tax=Flammeovirga sp. EKP202 TaxID=2770592 RepID=UPI00165F42AF|nr:sulfatase [Flammeovirga sp. EKP202]MBD0403900.1 sulfatase [Flammeovirga sp. EKP202]
MKNLYLISLLLLITTTAFSQEKDQRPNIIYIMSDDHALQAISAYGHEISKVAPTPNIDRIAKEGIQFNQSFVTNSLCGPSRATMLTGKYSHKNGFRHNSDTFDASQNTWVKELNNVGYATAIIGKWHLKSTPEGFDHWNILNDQGEYYNPDFISGGDTTMVEGYTTDLITDYSLEWLEEQKDKNEPFALLIHHKAPHRNWMPPLRYANEFDNVEFPVPDTYFDDYEGRVAASTQEMNVYRDMQEGHDLKMSVEEGSDEWRKDIWPHLFARLTPEQKEGWHKAYRAKNDKMHQANYSEKDLALWKYQRYLQDYCGTVKAVDENIGRVLDYLDENGLAENTIIVYTSDQGFYLGEHGWFDKRFMYEESFKTPLVMRYPKEIKGGKEAEAFVQNIDYGPTFLDFAGVEVPEDMQGTSMREITKKGKTPKDWRESVYYHYYEYPGFHKVKRQYGVRTQDYKLIHFYFDNDDYEFYDLKKDPQEMNNVINDPAYAKQISELKVELARLMKEADEPDFEEWKDTNYRKEARLKKRKEMMKQKRLQQKNNSK